MYCVTVNLTGEEWERIQGAASRQWPTEVLSCAEIVGRFTLTGIKTFQNLSPEARADQTRDFQQSIFSTDERLRH